MTMSYLHICAALRKDQSSPLEIELERGAKSLRCCKSKLLDVAFERHEKAKRHWRRVIDPVECASEGRPLLLPARTLHILFASTLSAVTVCTPFRVSLMHPILQPILPGLHIVSVQLSCPCRFVPLVRRKRAPLEETCCSRLSCRWTRRCRILSIGYCSSFLSFLAASSGGSFASTVLGRGAASNCGHDYELRQARSQRVSETADFVRRHTTRTVREPSKTAHRMECAII